MKRSLESSAVVINPRRYPKAVTRLEKMLAKTDVSDVVVSSSKEDFISAVRAFCESSLDNILVWGGDGTAHDAINAMMDHKEENPGQFDKSIGFLRGGSGNGIQDSYEIPHDLLKPLERQLVCYEESIREGYSMDVDLISADDGYTRSYCQIAGFGIDAKVLERREARSYKTGMLRGEAKAGMMNYALSSIETALFDYEFTPLDIELKDGKNIVVGHRTKAEHRFNRVFRETDAPLVELGTRPYYGKMFKICPDVVCNDGFMDLYIFNFSNRLDGICKLPWLYAGKHDRINRRFSGEGKPPIERYELKHAVFSSDRPFPYHIDGELCHSKNNGGEYQVQFSIVPEAIRFIVPGSFYRSFHWFENDRDTEKNA